MFIHISLFCLAALMAGRVASTAIYNPPPIEVEFEPSKLIDMGSGKLHFTSGSTSEEPVKVAKPKIRKAPAGPPHPVKPAPSQPAQPAPPAAVTKADTPSTRLPGETDATSVALPPQGAKATAGGSSGSGVAAVGSKGKGTGSAGDQDGNEGDYTGSGYRHGELPGYPSAARRAGREGIVTLRVLIDTDGKPASVTTLETSGYEDFDNVAVQAVKKWIFSPARRGGKPVASFHDVRIRFRLYDTR